jgi:hypothetical protein
VSDDVPEPPHDCRLTIRCLKECFGFRHEPPSCFDDLRSENTCIDALFERRQNDPAGGEGGERVQSVTSRPVYSLHCGKTRGATWFDRDEGVVWLLGVEQHDERHKGKSDAYDIFAGQEAAGVLFPAPVDYKLLELDRRLLDTQTFVPDVLNDALELVKQAIEDGGAEGTAAHIPIRLRVERDVSGTVMVAAAISMQPVVGKRSGLDFPLTQERFMLATEALRQAVEKVVGSDALADEAWEFPGGLRNERAAMIVA